MGQRLANCYEKTGRFEEAKTAYTNMIKLGKIPPEIYYRYALLCMRTGEKDKAETIFKKVIQLEPTNAFAHKDLGVIYLSQRLFDYAKEEFEKAYELAPDEGYIIFELANFYHATNDYNKAKEYYEKAYELENDSDINLFRALNYLALKETTKALDILEDVRKADPTNHIALQNIGLIYFANGNFEIAKEFLFDSYSLHQTSETLNALALCFYELKQYENAKPLALKLYEKYPENINVLLLLSKIYIELCDTENSVKYLDKIMKIFPEQPEAQELYNKINGVK